MVSGGRRNTNLYAHAVLTRAVAFTFLWKKQKGNTISVEMELMIHHGSDHVILT